MSGAMNPPVLMLEMLNRSRNERRSLDYFLLPASAAGEIPAQGPEELQKYFATRAQNFRAPEYRSLVMLAVRPETMAKPDLVSDEAAAKRYDEVKAARYSQPEKRNVQQLPFDAEAAAAEAVAKLKGGMTFEALAKERGLEDKDVDLGLVEKKALVGDIGTVAFGLAEGAVSDAVKNVFGFTLVRVTRIIPATVTPFADVSGDLKRELSLINARKEAQTLHDKIEDIRSAGKPLVEAAKAVGLEVRQIEAVDASGRDKAGVALVDLGDGPALLKAAFASGVGYDNDTITTRDRGNIWFEVTKVEPARANTLEEVKPLVEQAWRSEETARRLVAKATELVKKLNDGAPIADVAEAEGKLEVKHTGDAQRKGSPDLPPAVVVQVFNVGIGAAGSANAPGGRIVFKVLGKAVQPLDGTSDEAKKLETELRAELSDEIFTQYVAQLQGETGVKVNEALLRQLTGGEAN